jgi:hypothetical protein
VLLKLGEVLDGAQGAFGAVDLLVDLLIEQATQTHRVDPEVRGLRSIVRIWVKGSSGMAIGMVIEAREAKALGASLTLVGLIELLPGNGVSIKRRPFGRDRRPRRGERVLASGDVGGRHFTP